MKMPTATDLVDGVLREIPLELEPNSPRKRRFICDAANLTIYYDFPGGDTIVSAELCLADVKVGTARVMDVYIESDDYYKKFTVAPAERTTSGLVRSKAMGHVNVDKTEILERIKFCTSNLEYNVIDFLIKRIKKYMY
jgi:hypothetical protein